jgi:hypothetical protein
MNNFNDTIWDSELQNVGLPSNMQFTYGSEFGDIIYRLQKPNDYVRWCIFTVDRNYYVIKQEFMKNQWCELWTKQMDKDLSEAKTYCENDAFNHYK